MKKIFFLVVFILTTLVAQNTDKELKKKTNNTIFFEAAGSSTIVGLLYQRNFPIFNVNKKLLLQIKTIVGLSPSIFHIPFNFSISDGMSLPLGVGFYFLPGKLKFGTSFFMINNFYFNEFSFNDKCNENIIHERTHSINIQPQFNIEYHINSEFLVRGSFTPFFTPEFCNSQLKYQFYPFGGIMLGYKF